MKIENWSLVDKSKFGRKEFLLPDINSEMFSISGIIKKTDSETMPKGATLVSAPIVAIRGDLLVTKNDMEIELGTIDQDYKKFLKDNGITWTKKSVIKISL